MSTKKTPNSNPMAEWLRLASAEQRERCASLAGTSVNYLYQIAGLRREPKVGMGVLIEDATTTLHEESMGLLPVVTARDLATMHATEGLS